jgi:chromosomal replication initiation ATPase DnaA
MKNITFAADEDLIAAAREQAEAEGTTLNEQFRQWLAQYAAKRRAARAMEVIERVSKNIDLGGRKFTRDELNERR